MILVFSLPQRYVVDFILNIDFNQFNSARLVELVLLEVGLATINYGVPLCILDFALKLCYFWAEGSVKLVFLVVHRHLHSFEQVEYMVTALVYLWDGFCESDISYFNSLQLFKSSNILYGSCEAILTILKYLLASNQELVYCQAWFYNISLLFFHWFCLSFFNSCKDVNSQMIVDAHHYVLICLFVAFVHHTLLC